MTEGGCDDSDNFDDVLDGSHEEHEVHSVAGVHVVVFIQVLIAFLPDELSVGQLTIHVIQWFFAGVSIRVDCWDEASPEKWLHCYQLRPLFLEILLNDVFQHILEEILIFDADEPVFEDSRTFVSP